MSFAYYTPFAVDHTKCGLVDSTDFPVLLALSDARYKSAANGGHVQNANGYDLRPYATDGTTARDFELVNYNATLGTAELYYREPTLSATADTPVRLYYGDAGLAADGSTTSTWDTAYRGVYHLNEASGATVNDSTSNAFALSPSNSPTQGAGKVGGALTFNGSNQNATQSTAATLVNPATTDLTLSAWVNVAAFAGYRRIVMQSIDANTSFQFLTGDDNSGTSAAFTFIIFDGATEHAFATAPIYSTGTWYRLTGRYNTTTNALAVSVNGAAITPFTTSGFTVGNADNKLWIGGRSDGAAFFPGSVDEVRISNVYRSDDWVVTEYNNGVAPSTFAVMGTEVAMSGTTFTKSLAGSVTSAAALAKSVALANLGALTSSGVAARAVATFKAGAVTPSAAIAKRPATAKSGAVASSGAVARAAAIAKAGTTAASGAPFKLAAKPASGAVTSSGALSKIKVVLQTLSGAITSSGSLVRKAVKAAAGAVVSAGALSKLATKPASGAVASAGALARTKVVLQQLAGAITSSGSIAGRAIGKAIAGAIASAATIARTAKKSVAGASAPSGAPARAATKATSGTTAPGGTLAKRAATVAGGVLASSGALRRLADKAIARAIGWAGAVTLRGGDAQAPLIVYAPARFTPDDVQARFTPDDIQARFTPDINA